MKKVTIQFIKEYAKQFSYVCISKEYKTRYDPLIWVCDNNHSFKIILEMVEDV